MSEPHQEHAVHEGLHKTEQHHSREEPSQDFVKIDESQTLATDEQNKPLAESQTIAPQGDLLSSHVLVESQNIHENKEHAHPVESVKKEEDLLSKSQDKISYHAPPKKGSGVDSISSLDNEPPREPVQLPEEESLASRIARATALKDTAKPFVRGGLYDDAIKIYDNAFYALKPTGKDHRDKDFRIAMSLQNDIYNNLSYCYSQLERYQQAISYAKRVLITEKDNVKALYRLAICYQATGESAAAYEEIEKCQEAFKRQNPDKPLDPKIRELAQTLKEKCKTIIEERERKERELYARMMGNQVNKESQKAQKVPEEPERRSIFSYKIVRVGLGLGITGLAGYIMYQMAKRRAEEAARRYLPALIIAVGGLTYLRYVKGNERGVLLGVGLGVIAALVIQKAANNRAL